jgi:protein-disulfide isomerase
VIGARGIIMQSFVMKAAARVLLCCGISAVSVLAQAPAAAPADPFPPANPRFFDAPTPTVATVNAFLKAIWGYDANRIYRVMAIQKTQAPNVAKVTVFVTDPTPGAKVQTMQFFVTPDGKHAIADAVFDFGEKPFAANRAMLTARADGPARGALGKELLLVEFADMQCPHCKEAQATMDDLVRDFPQARVVFQNFPLTEIHPFAAQAASYGNCIADKSSSAFFVYLKDVFDHQEALNPELGETTLKNAVAKAGQDPAAVAACAGTPMAKKRIDSQIALANDAGVMETPMLAVNGHLLPLGSIPYETLKQIIVFQAAQDGVVLK